MGIYIMPLKIQPIAVPKSRYVFDGITSSLPVSCAARAHVALSVLASLYLYNSLSWYTIEYPTCHLTVRAYTEKSDSRGIFHNYAMSARWI